MRKFIGKGSFSYVLEISLEESEKPLVIKLACLNDEVKEKCLINEKRILEYLSAKDQISEVATRLEGSGTLKNAKALGIKKKGLKGQIGYLDKGK